MTYCENCLDTYKQNAKNVVNNLTFGKVFSEKSFMVKDKKQDVNTITRRVISIIAFAIFAVSIANMALNLQLGSSLASSNFVLSARAESLVAIALTVLSAGAVIAAGKNTVYYGDAVKDKESEKLTDTES